MEMIEQNTIITRADVVIEGHGVLTLHVEFEGGELPYRVMGENHENLGPHVKALLSTFRVWALDEMKNKPARVRRDKGMCRQIGHFMDDRWYNPEAVTLNDD